MRPFTLSPISLLLLTTFISTAQAEHYSLPIISVAGDAGEPTPYAIPMIPMVGTDSGEMIKRLPGANINNNGPLTSIAQYRGLYGDRVNVLIDGIRINQAGPNRMDSPLSYMPASRTSEVAVYRGIAPVSSGIETIGGTITADSRQSEFTNGEEAEVHGYTNAGYATNGKTRYGSILASVANENHRLQATASTDKGDDLDFPGGEIIPTRQQRQTYDIGYGFQQDQHELSLDAGYHNTENTGTPALPMDIVYARGENYKGEYDYDLSNGAKLEATLHYQDSEHRMSNYVFRNKPNAMQRYADTDVEMGGYKFTYDQINWRLGIDGDQSEHNADIFNPNNKMFFVNNYNEVERDRYGFFGEWDSELTSNWKIETGLRYSLIKMDAGKVDSSMAMMPNMMGENVKILRDNFNNADRQKDDHLVDIVAKLLRPISNDLDIELGFARKERAPSYQERYLWLPLESTSGLADGNNYIGDINLKPEVAYQFELGLDWHASKGAISPRVFYHHINDYIQGTPSTNMTANMLSAMMGNPDPLQFSNVDAKLYGIDAGWLLPISQQWQLDGTVSYVRGERRDISDNLYRIAPLTARTMLSYHQPTWQVGIEAITVSSQNKVSETNNEKKSGGYAVFNLNANYQASKRVSLNAGVANLFDREYEDHLGGYYRVSGNPDIAQGDRIPNPGVSVFAGINVDW